MIRILLTNDDGIDAKGLRAMKDALMQIPNVDVWVVAPDGERSACSHSMSLGKPIYVEKRDDQEFAHSGVVADGVYWALIHLMADAKPHIVVSGMNRGANLAEDVLYSGTVAGAREAVLRNVHGLAVSLVSGDDFEVPAQNAAQVAVSIAQNLNDAPKLLNLNYPKGSFTGPHPCALGTRPYQPRVVEIESNNHLHLKGYLLGGPPVEGLKRPKHTDVECIDAGKASITPLEINQTAFSHISDKCFSFLNQGDVNE